MALTTQIEPRPNPGSWSDTDLRAQVRRLVCSEIWGGTGALDQEVATGGVRASIYSIAVGGGRGGDIHYLSDCSQDVLTRIAVGDVRGHGESVTMVSAWVYDALRSGINSVHGEQVLSELNRKICSRGLEAMTTAVVLTYDSSESVLHFCYAGHPPALLRRGETEWKRLVNPEEHGASNLPLGVRDSTVYEQGRVAVSPGDQIVVFTDGLVEAENATGDVFDEERLLEVLKRNGSRAVSAIKYAVLSSLLDHTGPAPLADDLTILTVEIR